MSDTMARFFGSLGAFAAPVQEIARGADCGCGLGAATQMLDASDAIARVLQQYAALSTQGERLRQILVAGGQVPCPVWDAYNHACLDYLAKSQLVFDQLTQKSVVVDQVVYSAGKPVSDPTAAGQYKTLRVTAPLRPPGFGFVATSCPGITNFQGNVGVSGWTPIPVEMGAVSTTVLSAVSTGAVLVLSTLSGTVVGVVGYAMYKTYLQTNVSFDAFDDQPLQVVMPYADCIERAMKSGSTAKNANAACFGTQASSGNAIDQLKTKLTTNGWGFWTWVAIGGGVLVVGSLIAAYLRNKIEQTPESASNVGPEAMSGFGSDTNHPLIRPLCARKTRRGHMPLLLGDLYLHPRG